MPEVAPTVTAPSRGAGTTTGRDRRGAAQGPRGRAAEAPPERAPAAGARRGGAAGSEGPDAGRRDSPLGGGEQLAACQSEWAGQDLLS